MKSVPVNYNFCFINFTFQTKKKTDVDSLARAKRSPRKNPPKKPTVKQPPIPQQDFRSDCMTPALEVKTSPNTIFLRPIIKKI